MINYNIIKNIYDYIKNVPEKCKFIYSVLSLEDYEYALRHWKVGEIENHQINLIHAEIYVLEYCMDKLMLGVLSLHKEPLSYYDDVKILKYITNYIRNICNHKVEICCMNIRWLKPGYIISRYRVQYI